MDSAIVELRNRFRRRLAARRAAQMPECCEDHTAGGEIPFPDQLFNTAYFGCV
jgi:hypothetical protein